MFRGSVRTDSKQPVRARTTHEITVVFGTLSVIGFLFCTGTLRDAGFLYKTGTLLGHGFLDDGGSLAVHGFSYRPSSTFANRAFSNSKAIITDM
jgi:hypothetical protein